MEENCIRRTGFIYLLPRLRECQNLLSSTFKYVTDIDMPCFILRAKMQSLSCICLDLVRLMHFLTAWRFYLQCALLIKFSTNFGASLHCARLPPRYNESQQPESALPDDTASPLPVKPRKPVKVCIGCGKSAPQMRKCSRCKMVYVCSQDCWVSAWKTSHKHFCSGQKEGKEKSKE